MRRFGILLLAATVMFMTVAPAAAHGPGFHGRVFFGPLLAPLLLPFAVAATITAGVAAVVTAPFTYQAAPYPPAPAYSQPVYASPPPPPAPAPPAYAASPPPPAPVYWYYCPGAGYYPYVSTCAAGWLTVVPR